jgi:hypothetical protein
MLAGIVLIGSTLSLGSSSVSITSSGVVSTILPLHVSGDQILNAANQSVILRGVNLGDFQASVGGEWEGTWITSYSQWISDIALVNATLAAAQSWGANAVRSHYAVDFWTENTSGFIPIIKSYAKLLASRGMYLIFDGYQVVDYGHGGNQDPLPYPPYQANTTSGRGSTVINPATIIPSQAAYVNYMISVAEALKNYPNVIIEFWNEPMAPVNESQTQPPWVTSGFLRCIQNITTQVRALGINNILLAQWDSIIWINLNYPPAPPPAKNGNFWPGVGGNQAGVLEWIPEMNLNGTNIAYSFHDYDSCGQNVTYSQVITGLTDLWIPYILNTVQKPLICGEVGANLDWTGVQLTEELNQFNYTLQAFRYFGIGFFTFGFFEGTAYGEISSYAPNWTPTSAGVIAEWNLLRV